MGKINVLSEHLSNMIAAGEVVERPSGIVKELVENSIDAHAKTITIDVVQGGIERITITDDGEGMDAQDATTAFERHATSKMREENDLWNIQTMGFRGEALPSIASVSHVVLETNNGEESSMVEIRYGKFIAARPCACPLGTSIRVEHLFQKTPARFKHLKTPQYEFSLISDVVQKFALAYPQIRFTLTHEGRTVFQTKGSGSLREVLMQMYDRSVAKSAIAIQGEDLDYRLDGMAVQPKYHRATKYFIFLFVNRRMVRSYRLQKAVLDAYHPYLPKDRYPIVVLNVEMDAHLVDVNVHPSKWEIRLSKERQLEKLIYETLREALKKEFDFVHLESRKETKETMKLQAQPLQFTYPQDTRLAQLEQEVNDSFVPYEAAAAPDLSSTFVVESASAARLKPVIKTSEVLDDQNSASDNQEKNPPSIIQSASETAQGKTKPFIKEAETTESALSLSQKDESATKEEADAFIARQSQRDQRQSKERPAVSNDHAMDDETREEAAFDQPQDTASVTPSASWEGAQGENTVSQGKAESDPPATPQPALTARQRLPQLRVIGQFHKSYILAEGDDGLYIIDQHAAQERYHYEQIRAAILSGRNETQQLLLPLQLETSIYAVSRVEELNALLSHLGICFEPFGEQTLLCRSLPLWMKQVDEKGFLTDMIDVWQRDEHIDIASLREHAIATMACHSSIRFNRSLTIEEMRRVIADLDCCEQPFHCPHGRPTIICMNDAQLRKEFERG